MNRDVDGSVDVSPSELLRLRQHSQRIDPALTRTAADTVRHLLALQAQDFANALWAVGLRTPGSVRSDVLAALERGVIVRTLPMRGTLHFIAAEDLRWMLDLTSARTLQSLATRFRNLGLEPATLTRSESIASRALAGGRMSRQEFMTLLADNGIAPDGQRGYHVIAYLTQRGLVCWGPPSGNQQALVLVDEWIPPQSEGLPRNVALAQFALRYFAGHGPATERDLAWWGKLTLTDARAAIENCRHQLTRVTCGGAEYWVETTELQAASSSPPASTLHALPGFDEYLLGYTHRSLALAPEHAQQIVPGSNGVFLPTIVDEGRVVGTWRRAPATRSTPATIMPTYFDETRRDDHQGFSDVATSYARFIDG